MYRTAIRGFSPVKIDTKNKYEMNLPNQDRNYQKSPAAKRAIEDGSLDRNKEFNRTFNRKLKMRDTFTNIFPTYNHGEPTCYQKTMMHSLFSYPREQEDGSPMHKIDRTFTHKMDEIKQYSESMYKVQSMRREFPRA